MTIGSRVPAEDAGADGITAHLREDRRHISDHDIERLIVGGTHRRNPDAGKPVTINARGETLVGPVGFTLD